MNTTLSWMPPNNVEGVFYSVTYSEYGSDIWHRKVECTDITWTWCNLAHETNNYETIYYGNVTVSSQNCSISEISEGFQPCFQTILGPPKINLLSTTSSIVINLTHPIVDHFHGQFKYHIYLDGIHVKETEISYYKKDNLDSHTKYCITAKLLVFGRESSMSKTTCVTTKSDYISEDNVKMLHYILPVVLATLIFILTVYAVHKYINVSNLRKPHILDTISRNGTNALFFEMYSVPVNVIIIDRDIKNLQCNMISEKEESLYESYNIKLYEDDLSRESHVTDQGNCYGYDRFQDNVQIAKPIISTYDMPHWTFDSCALNKNS
ncbi:interleukin-20 receptor subunit alpha isoform 2-T2 [Mantella aurantiaca]